MVAIACARDERAYVWVNLTHATDEPRLIWEWARHAAQIRPPLAVLYADDLVGLHARLHGGHDAAE